MWWWLTNEWVWKIPFEFKILILDFAIFQELSSFIHFNWWIQIMIIIVFNLVPQYLPYMDILHQEFANYNCKTIKYLDIHMYSVMCMFWKWHLRDDSCQSELRGRHQIWFDFWYTIIPCSCHSINGIINSDQNIQRIM